ncbi:MAG: hypothetical protein GWN00_08785 [Aliifodinibius sp.]|nr:hypothetical protein [Phycisphaerae bacterium]NIT56313.1 hypothetical protein [Fodinibius sp.]NIY24896.1 hypothetical protein [Fodinibius sp.]
MKFDFKTIAVVVALCVQLGGGVAFVMTVNGNLSRIQVNTADTAKEVKELRQEVNDDRLEGAVLSNRVTQLERDVTENKHAIAALIKKSY